MYRLVSPGAPYFLSSAWSLIRSVQSTTELEKENQARLGLQGLFLIKSGRLILLSSLSTPACRAGRGHQLHPGHPSSPHRPAAPESPSSTSRTRSRRACDHGEVPRSLVLINFIHCDQRRGIKNSARPRSLLAAREIRVRLYRVSLRLFDQVAESFLSHTHRTTGVV